MTPDPYQKSRRRRSPSLRALLGIGCAAATLTTVGVTTTARASVACGADAAACLAAAENSGPGSGSDDNGGGDDDSGGGGGDDDTSTSTPGSSTPGSSTPGSSTPAASTPAGQPLGAAEFDALLAGQCAGQTGQDLLADALTDVRGADGSTRLVQVVAACDVAFSGDVDAALGRPATNIEAQIADPANNVTPNQAQLDVLMAELSLYWRIAQDVVAAGTTDTTATTTDTTATTTDTTATTTDTTAATTATTASP